MSNVSDKAEMFRLLQEQNKRFAVDEPELPLKHGGGNGTSGGMEPSMKDYVDARDAQNLSDMKSEFEKLRGDIAKLPTTWTMITILVAIAGFILAAMAFAGTRFSAGMSVADIRQEQLARDADQDQSVKQINEKLDLLVADKAKSDAPLTQAK